MEHEISKEKSLAISLVRILATVAIVLCHYLQAYHDKWAWVLNVGVQVFLVLSGYLYGHKEVSHWGKWFFNRFVKLYVPLYIFSTIVLLLIKYCTTTPVGIMNFIKTGGVDGLGHLWFMKAITLCYIITPILQFLRRYSNIVFSFIVFVAIFEYCYLQESLFMFSWIFLYSIGYFFPTIHQYYQRIVQMLMAIIIVVLTIYISWPDIHNYDGVYNRAWHDMMGIFICLCVIPIFELFKMQKLPSLLKWIDNNSFYLYLSHYTFLLGPLSLITIIHNKCLAILLSFLCMIVCTIMLGRITRYFSLQLNKILK